MIRETTAAQAAVSALSSRSMQQTPGRAGFSGRSSMDQLPALPDQFIRRLWLRMTQIFGHRWTSAYGADAFIGDDTDGSAGSTWANGLRGVTPAQLGVGFNACVTSGSDWPPSLPEFRAMCLGVPTLAAVQAEIGGKIRSIAERSPFAIAVWRALDGYAYSTAPSDKAGAMLRSAYEDVRERVMRGELLPEAPPAIAAEVKPFVPADPEVVRRELRELERFFRGQTAS